jgi:hypothetical protein
MERKSCKKIIHLKMYDECVGIFYGFKHEGDYLIMHIGGNEIILQSDIAMTSEIVQELQGITEGNHVALLRASPHRFVIRKARQIISQAKFENVFCTPET